jgi:hypothetical protein
MEPGFALAAAQHLARADRPTFIAVWEAANGNARGRLLGLWALVLPRSMFRSHVGTLWCHKQAALGVPLLDTECAEETIAAIFTWLAETYPRLRLIVFPKLIRSGPTFAACWRTSAAASNGACSASTNAPYCWPIAPVRSPRKNAVTSSHASGASLKNADGSRCEAPVLVPR